MLRKVKPKIVLQQDLSDCGVACLLSAVRYFDGNNNLESLRKICGTNGAGTTLLGLRQGSAEIGIDADAFEAEIRDLIDLKELCILHLTFENGREHFVLNYGYDFKNERFLIGDPAKGISFWKENEILEVWKTKVLMTLKPNRNFTKSKVERIAKKKWFISLLKEDYNILLVATFFGIVISGLGLSTAIFTQKLVDDIIPKHDTSRMISGFGIFLLLLFARSVIAFTRQLFILQQAKDFNERINSSFINKLLKLPKLFFDSRKTGDLIARLNDTMRIQKSITYLSGTFVIDFLVVLSSAIYLFHFHFSIALTALSSIPLMGLIAWRFNDKIIKQNIALMASYSANESSYIDTIQGIDIIKSTGKEGVFSRKIASSFNQFQESNINLGKTSNRFNLIVEIFASLIVVSIMIEVTYFTLQKELKIGEMMAVLSIGIGLIPSCTRLMLTNLQIKEAKVAYNRMYEFASIKPEDSDDFSIDKSWDSRFDKLEIRDLTFRFPGRRPLLESINLEVTKGKITALMGESGCGKSTLLQILQKFYISETGDIVINDKFKLRDIETKSWRTIISTVAQDIRLFNCSILENICLSEEEEDVKSVFALCEQYDLLNYFNQFPQGLFTKVGDDGLNLSGGQKQIVGLLRALYTKPQFLLLDEATAALDAKTESFILHLLSEIKETMGILMVTHKENTAEIADSIIYIKNSKTPCVF